MTKGISDMLGVPHLDEILKEQGIELSPPEAEEEEETLPVQSASGESAYLAMMKDRLRDFEGTDHAKAMNEIYRETLDHSRNLMDLGYNVDDRSRRGIFEIAVQMYKNAIDSKNSKRDAELKVLRLMLDQQKQDLAEKQFKLETGQQPDVDTEGTIIVDRNEMIRKMREQIKAEKAEIEAEKDD